MRQPIPDAASSSTSLGPHSRRLMITAPGAVELIEEHLLPVGERDVYAHTVISGISHGTEIAWLRGEAAALHRRWDADRRFFLNQPGRDYPVAPGYESVARAEHVGPAVTAVAAGDLIAVDAPHADGHLLSEQAAVAGRLPDGADPEQAVFLHAGTGRPRRRPRRRYLLGGHGGRRRARHGRFAGRADGPQCRCPGDRRRPLPATDIGGGSPGRHGAAGRTRGGCCSGGPRPDRKRERGQGDRGVRLLHRPTRSDPLPTSRWPGRHRSLLPRPATRATAWRGIPP